MEQDFDISRLLALRSLTTPLAELLAHEAREHLRNLAPLLNPRALFGELILGEKGAVKGSDLTFQELVKLYQAAARITALNLEPDLKPPLGIFGLTPEIFTASYTYTPPGHNKPITMITPLKWVLIYKDLGPERLRELVAAQARGGGGELKSCVLHYLVMQLLAKRRPGIAPLLEALRFTLTTGPSEEFGGLPFAYLASPIPTVRPPDPLIVQSTMISGTSTFEEVVDVSGIANLADPLRDRILAVVKEHGAPLLSEAGG
ncbi:MAG: hypothetical protein HZB55_17810 [Deltaproteobacteria bacterium]|nr:hypothetical protein [Deltaproteobacteria bacterium]